MGWRAPPAAPLCVYKLRPVLTRGGFLTLWVIMITLDIFVRPGYCCNMSDKDLTDLIDVPPEDQMGPAMLRLNRRQRIFVCALAVFGGDQTAAYKHAGYECSNDRSAQAASSRLANAEDIIQAIREESLRRINSATLLAVSTLVEMASPRNADQRLRRQAAVDILDRTNFNPKTEHTIIIKDDRTTAELIESITQLANANGLDPRKLLMQDPIIDTVAVDVSPSVDELEPDMEGLDL